MNYSEDFHKQAGSFRATIKANDGRLPSTGSKEDNELRSNFKSLLDNENTLQNLIGELRYLRAGDDKNDPVDITLGELVEQRFGLKTDAKRSSFAFLEAIGVKLSSTIQSLYTTNQVSRGAADWLIPEIVVDAIRMGIDASLLEELVGNSYNVNGMDINVPAVELGQFRPKELEEAETIPLGKIKFDNKSVKLSQVGIGIGLTDRVVKYTRIDMLAEQLKAVGRHYVLAENALIIQTLLDGEQSDGSYSAPVIGVTTPNTLTYKDIQRVMIRTDNLQLPTTHFIANEEETLTYWNLPEIQGSGTTSTPLLAVDIAGTKAVKGIPHGLVPTKTILMVNAANAISRLVAQELQTESERIASNQLTNTYVTKTVGYYKQMLDAAIKLDYTADIAGAGAFPDYMDIEALQAQGFRKQY